MAKKKDVDENQHSDIIEHYKNTKNDFGFSAVDSLEDPNNISYKDRLKKIEEIVLPLLVNLMESEGDIIKWPNRRPAIKEKIDEILKLTR